MILFFVRFFTYSSAQMAFWHFVNGFSDKMIQVRKWLFSPIFRHFLCVFLNMYLLDFAILRHSFTVFCKNQTFVNGFFSEKTPSFRAFIFVLIFMVFVNGFFYLSSSGNVAPWHRRAVLCASHSYGLYATVWLGYLLCSAL